MRNALLGIGLLLSVTLSLAPTSVRAAEEEPGSLELFETLQSRVVSVAKDVTQSVVYVEAILKQQNRKAQVSGTGVIADGKGYIFTNHHVVEQAIKVTVTVPGVKVPFPAEIVGADQQTDLAVLKIDPGEHKLKAARFGSSEELQVGHWVLAIGNPYGFDNSVSLGIVQAKGRNLQFRGLINSFIQTDALIDQGSSGGPLVNLKGEVVGINSIAAGRGMGFTIPIETALDVKRKLLEEGTIERAWLGITFQPLSPALAGYWKLDATGGAIVSGVIEGSPAQKAGMKAGDIIVEIGGETVDVSDESEASSLTRLVAKYPVGTEVDVTVLRQGKRKKLEVDLGATPPVEAKQHESEWGFGYEDITTGRQLAARLASRDGAFVTFVERGSSADEAGLEAGDVVVKVGERKVTNAAELSEALAATASSARVLLTTRRGADVRFVLLERLPGGHVTEGEASPVKAE